MEANEGCRGGGRRRKEKRRSITRTRTMGRGKNDASVGRFHGCLSRRPSHESWVAHAMTWCRAVGRSALRMGRGKMAMRPLVWNRLTLRTLGKIEPEGRGSAILECRRRKDWPEGRESANGGRLAFRGRRKDDAGASKRRRPRAEHGGRGGEGSTGDEEREERKEKRRAITRTRDEDEGRREETRTMRRARNQETTPGVIFPRRRGR